jgi:hypothetical protein
MVSMIDVPKKGDAPESNARRDALRAALLLTTAFTVGGATGALTADLQRARRDAALPEAPQYPDSIETRMMRGQGVVPFTKAFLYGSTPERPFSKVLVADTRTAELIDRFLGKHDTDFSLPLTDTPQLLEIQDAPAPDGDHDTQPPVDGNPETGYSFGPFHLDQTTGHLSVQHGIKTLTINPPQNWSIAVTREQDEFDRLDSGKTDRVGMFVEQPRLLFTFIPPEGIGEQVVVEQLRDGSFMVREGMYPYDYKPLPPQVTEL